MKLIRLLKPFSNIHPIWEHWNHICEGEFATALPHLFIGFSRERCGIGSDAEEFQL